MIKAIVTDIEGTTSSISFVHQVLFPYARKHLPDFVRAHAADEQVAALLNDVAREAGHSLDTEQAIELLCAWIEQDRKVTSLKSLQGLIWEDGYRNADYHGHIYPDALQALRAWHAAGIRLAVYSSGSVYAQKLLFGHTEAGDLTPLFEQYFDTHIGGKREAASYRAIASALALPDEQILFLSDIVEELDAARSAGLHTCWLVRDAAPDAHARHPQVADFSAIDLAVFEV